MPCRLARQFGYDQLLVGNPNQSLDHVGGSLHASWCWYYSIVCCTRARFMLPGESRPVYMSLGFCKSYSGANQTPTFNSKTSLVSLILKHFASLEGSKAHKRILGMKDFMEIKHKLKEGIAPVGNVGGIGRSATLGPKRSSSSEKLPVKQKLDVSPPSVDRGRNTRDREEGARVKIPFLSLFSL